MNSISDIIEHYLIKILQQSNTDFIEVKRSKLADTFQCVPSQINYVISTRFTTEKGYFVESKRGGGGYIRIRRVRLHSPSFEDLLENIGESISQVTAEHVIIRLLEEQFMTQREAMLMQHLIAREILRLPTGLRDEIRARIMKAMITILFISKGE
jgi:transcriptional regulator of stress and heat shock response